MEATELLKPKIDVVFHALFREENNVLLEAMLSAILGKNIKIEANLDRHLNIATSEEKLGVMDLRVRFEDGTNCNIEIQLNSYSYENERFLYYLADTYSRQLLRGKKYEEINKTISIVIIDHETEILKDMEELNIKWQMRDEKTGKRLLTDKFELVIIELPKAKRIYLSKNYDKTSQWMMFLDNPNSKEVINIMDNNKDIKKASEALKQVSGDYELRRIAELREKAIRDEQAALDYAKVHGLKAGREEGLKQGLKEGLKQGHEEGFKQGREEGIEQGIEITAKNMLNLGVDLDIIIKATGLSKEQLLKLSSKNN